MKRFKLLVMALVVVLSAFALAGCGSSDQKAGDATNTGSTDASLQTVLDRGVLRVGMCPEYPPFESINENNEIVGFDPSLAAAIGKEWGVEVECINTPWEGLIAGLNNGDYDVIMSAMSPEEATAATKAVELSENYYELADVIVVRADNTDIKSKEDLAGKIVGVQDACSAAQAAEDLPNQGIKVAKLNHYTRNAEAYAELANGRIDALVVSLTYANEQAKNNPGYKVINDPLHNVGIAVVAKEGSVALINKINETVNKLKANGTYDEIAVQWLAAD
ncbi:ABC transporter arginine-binding protein 1 precursor [Sporotomaculum syntrophicum]|uniref:ABC transporter arginine-binding protein 1 n=1 Tax=Sporotomaculum syntrophicum TaxID=182264 RepID=A0A9D3AVZ5_9FIRM|nr:transporter substrate-binding domain-containing protein [Sporotomaculum syntrophicum]KAF1084775.1 ABC transporter arginine-binding protein 1 precursor [Sporotomaculum syntrophicum]